MRACKVAQACLDSKLPDILLEWIDVWLLDQQFPAQVSAILHIYHPSDFSDGSHLLLERHLNAHPVGFYGVNLVFLCFF